MRISILINSLEGGGAERVVSQLVPYLEAKGFDVFLVLSIDAIVYDFKFSNEITFLETTKANENGLLKFLKLPFLAWKYSKFLKKNKIDISLSFLTRPAYISCIAKIFNNKFSIIISERSNPSSQYGYKNLKSKINRFLIKKLYPKSDLIITNSKGNAIDLIEHFNIDKAKINTIYNPIDLIKIDQITAKDDFFDSNYINFVTIGRLDEGKNHDLLIRAFNSFKNRNIRLYIFGTGHLFDVLSNKIKELDLQDQVILMGFVNNPFEYLKAADCFIFGSNHEGFPNVLLEALACKIPIISTNCPSGPSEIFDVFGKDFSGLIKTDYGMLVEVNDLFSMIKAIEEFVDHTKLKYDTDKLYQRASCFSSKNILHLYESELLTLKS